MWGDSVMMQLSRKRVNICMLLYMLALCFFWIYSPTSAEGAFFLFLVGVESFYCKTDRYESFVSVFIRHITYDYALGPEFERHEFGALAYTSADYAYFI